MKCRLSVLIVSYNTRDLTVACLRSLFRETPASMPFEVRVVDNNSQDGSAAAIESEFPQVTLVKSAENLGFARANNLAAEGTACEYLLLLNPDTVVLDRAVERLLDFAEAMPEAGIWGGRTLFADGALNPTSCFARPTPWSLFCLGTGLSSLLRESSLFNPEAYGGWRRETVRKVDIVTGCFMLIRRDIWEQLGGLDPAYFMYGEEADFCLRAESLGVRPAVTPSATIVHYGGASQTVRADKMVRLLQSKARLMRRHWSPRAATFGIAMLALWPFTRAFAWFVLSAVAPKRSLANARTWEAIWRRRAEWIDTGDPLAAPVVA